MIKKLINRFANKVLKIDLSLSPHYLTLLIRNRERIVYNKNIKALLSENDKGVFSILPMHARMITTIKNQIIIWPLEGEKQKLIIKTGILKVWLNQVQVFLDVESPL